MSGDAALALAVAGAVGLARVVTHSWIFRDVRARTFKLRAARPGYLGEAADEFTHCSQCVGFWAGLLCAPIAADGWLAALAIAGASSLAATILDRVIARHLAS